MTRTTITIGSTVTIVVEDDSTDPALAARVSILEQKMTGALGELDALQADFDSYKGEVNDRLGALAQQVTDLQAAIAANDPAAVDAKIADIVADVDAARAALTPAPAAADVPADAPADAPPVE